MYGESDNENNRRGGRGRGPRPGGPRGPRGEHRAKWGGMHDGSTSHWDGTPSQSLEHRQDAMKDHPANVHDRHAYQPPEHPAVSDDRGYVPPQPGVPDEYGYTPPIPTAPAAPEKPRWKRR